jgi:hypothetical protein
MSRTKFLAGLTLGLTLAASHAHADPATCQKAIIQNLLKFKKVYLKRHEKCLDAHNVGKVTVDCPDAATQLKIGTTTQKIVLKIADSCSAADAAALGYTDCNFEPAAGGKEAQCASDFSPITDGTSLASCLGCWKEAELREYLAVLYASHAVQLCGSLDESSATCSDLDCPTPTPDQHDLGDTGENDCQRAIGKAGVKYLLSREKLLEKCALAGGTQASCLADLKLGVALQKADDKKKSSIKKKCGNRNPVSSASFCCRTAPQQQQCVAAATREDCLAIPNADVVEGKFCAGDNTCSNIPGGEITWWTECPESNTCPGATVATIDDLIACVDTTADAVIDEMLCLQLRGTPGWPCPAGDGSPSGAFLN